jgi:hypothetical protein
LTLVVIDGAEWPTPPPSTPTSTSNGGGRQGTSPHDSLPHRALGSWVQTHAPVLRISLIALAALALVYL